MIVYQILLIHWKIGIKIIFKIGETLVSRTPDVTFSSLITHLCGGSLGPAFSSPSRSTDSGSNDLELESRYLHGKFLPWKFYSIKK